MPQQTRSLIEDDGIEFVEDAVLQRLKMRVRRSVVAFLADLADGTRADRGPGLMAFNPLLDYPANTVGSRLKSIITGIGEGQPWADVDTLIAEMVGKIDLAALHSDLQATIDLITADAATGNSVNKRLADEAQARSQALLAEAQSRATAISDAIGSLQTTLVQAFEAGDSTVNSRITTEVANSVERDSALGVRVDTVSARLNVGGDIYNSLATANSYAYTKAAVDTAIAASAASLTSTFGGADGALSTRITNEAQASSDRDAALGTRVDAITTRLDSGDIAATLASLATYAYTKAQTDSALASQASTLRAEYNGINARLNAGGDIHTSLATANSYAYTKAQSDSALSNLGTTLTSSFTNADNAISARLNAGGDIHTSLATANSYAYTKAQSDSALSNLGTTLTSSFTNADNAISARLNAGGDIHTSLATANSYAYTKAQADSALASQATLLRAEYQGPLGSLSGSVSSLQTAVAGPNGLQSQLVLKTVATRADGKPVIGFLGLASTANNDGSGGSELVLQADRIFFVPSSDLNAAPSSLMVLGTVNGVATLIVPAARIGDATITPGKMSVVQLSAISANMGTLLAGSITAGFYQSDVPGARRVTINEGGGNDIRVYSALGSSMKKVVQIGESWDANFGYSFVAAGDSNSNSVTGVFGVSYGAAGVQGSSGSGAGVAGFSLLGFGGVFGSSSFSQNKGIVQLIDGGSGVSVPRSSSGHDVAIGPWNDRLRITGGGRIGTVLDTGHMTLTTDPTPPSGGFDGDLWLIYE